MLKPAGEGVLILFCFFAALFTARGLKFGCRLSGKKVSVIYFAGWN